MSDDQIKSKRLVAFEDFSELPSMKWLIDGIIPLHGVVMDYGSPKGGKSLTVQSQMLACAAREHWCGFETRYAKGLYIVSEGFHGVLRRHAAWIKSRGIIEPLDVRYWRGAVNFLDLENSVKPFVAKLKQSKWEPKHLAIDTVAKAMPGANDSDIAKASLFCTNVRWLEQELCDTITRLVHHATKYDDIFRGAGVWDADIDGMTLYKKVEQSASVEQPGATGWQQMMNTKASDIGKLRAIDISCIHFRDADPFQPFRVGIELVEVMTDEGPQEAPTIKDRIDVPAQTKKQSSSADHKLDRDLDDLVATLADDFGGGATFTDLKNKMQAKFPRGGWSETSFRRRLDLAQERGLMIGGGGKGELWRLASQVVSATQESISATTSGLQPLPPHSHPLKGDGGGGCNNGRQSPPNNSHGGNGGNASTSRSGENSVEQTDPAGKDVRALLAAEQARLRAMKEKKDGEG